MRALRAGQSGPGNPATHGADGVLRNLSGLVADVTSAIPTSCRALPGSALSTMSQSGSPGSSGRIRQPRSMSYDTMAHAGLWLTAAYEIVACLGQFKALGPDNVIGTWVLTYEIKPEQVCFRSGKRHDRQ